MKPEKAVGDLLRAKGWTLSVAESCTGGGVSDRITDVPGSSDYFQGAMVTYSNPAKARHLAIPIAYIEKHGAVSEEVARAMARGVRKAFRTTLGLSTTGVAGPTGGTKKTPVGTVFIAVTDGRRDLVRREHLKGSRKKIKKEAAEKGLQHLFEYLLKPAVSRPASRPPRKGPPK